MRKRIQFTITRKTLAVAALLLGAVLVAGGAAVYFGIYNVSALTSHTEPVYRFLEFARIRAVKVREPEDAPDLDTLPWQSTGLRIYENHCLQCHGAPGIAPEPFSLGMMPPPSAIVRVARQRTPEELYWVIFNGIKMSGMPAWKYRLKAQEIWELVAFLKKLPTLTVAEYAALRDATGQHPVSEHRPEPGAADTATAPPLSLSGKEALRQYNCVSCHQIEGLPSASHAVGPPLSTLTSRSFIAGKLPMNRENLVQWIMAPQQFKPGTTMPDLGVDRVHAVLMADYLFSLNPSEAPSGDTQP